MKILFNYIDYKHNPERQKLDEYGGVGYYRIVKVAQNVKGHEVDIMGGAAVRFGHSQEENWRNVFNKYDVVWTSYGYGDKNLAIIIYLAQTMGKKLIMDVDDNFLDVPESNELYDKFKPGKRDRALLATALSFCDSIIVSTEPLRERLHKHFKQVHNLEKNIVVIPNMNDVKDWQHTPAPKHEDKIVIGYSGSNSHKDDLRMVMPVIAKLMNKYPNVLFEIVGSVPQREVKEYFGHAGFNDDSLERLFLLPSTTHFKAYPAYLASLKWDIGIAPLVDSPFTRSKSHIKWMEYSMYEIPVVASRVYPYFMELKGRDTIRDEETGFLCRTAKEWEEKLEALIQSKELRQKIGKQAKKFIEKNWQYDSEMVTELVNNALK